MATARGIHWWTCVECGFHFSTVSDMSADDPAPECPTCERAPLCPDCLDGHEVDD